MNTAGRSARTGRRSRPRTSSTSAATSPDSTARPSANHSGLLPRPIASLVSGQPLLSSSTETNSSARPLPFAPLPDAARAGCGKSLVRDMNV